jgi:hypothetical protein
MHLVYLKLSDDTTIPILGVQDAAIAKKNWTEWIYIQVDSSEWGG